jgi:protein-tyrosine-phosphatase
MASAIFQRLLDESGSDLSWRVESAGTWAIDGIPAAAGSVQVMSDRGLDIRNHMARYITGELLSSFDLILTMENDHKEALRAEFPGYAGCIYLLSEMAGYSHDIRDPIGGPISDYEAVAQELTHLLDQGFERIKTMASSGHA